MKYLLFLAVVMQVQACSILDIEHREGELPKLKLNGAEKVCTEKLGAKLKSDMLLFECKVKL